MRFHRAIIDAAESARIGRAYAGVAGRDPALHGPAAPALRAPVAGRRRAHASCSPRSSTATRTRADELFRRHLTDAVQNLSSALAAGEGTDAEEVTL